MHLLQFSLFPREMYIPKFTIVLLYFLNCEREEYSLCLFFPHISAASLPSLLLWTNPDLSQLHHTHADTHTKPNCCVFIEYTSLRPFQLVPPATVSEE